MAFMGHLQSRLPLLRKSAIVSLQLVTALHLIATDVLEIRLSEGFSMLPTFSNTGDFLLISPIPIKFHTSAFESATRGESSSSLGSKLKRDLGLGVRRGDIVVATSPTDPTKIVCKRVIGLEGDVIEVDPLRRRNRKKTEEVNERMAQARERRRREIAERRRAEAQSGEKGKGKEIVDEGEGKERLPWEELDANHRAALRQAEREKSSSPSSLSSSSEESHLPPVFKQGGVIANKGEREIIRIPRGHVWLAGDNMNNSTDSRTYGPVPLGLLKAKVLARVYPNPKWVTNEVKELGAESS